MNLKAIFFVPLLTSLWSASCTSATTVEPSLPPVASSASSGMPVTQSWEVLVESLANHPEVLTKDWAAMRRILPTGCFRNSDSRDLNCPPMEGVVRVSVDPGPTGIVDVVLKFPASCDQIYTLMSRHLGKGFLEDGDKCSAEWKLNRWVKRANANLSRGRKDPSLLYLQFAIEQGP
ncbi:MAG: hypothetical protein KGL90_00040 [Burkholderiales bacterium]|nr:hypothetical protein [Burkholderiales bacterium]